MTTSEDDDGGGSRTTRKPASRRRRHLISLLGLGALVLGVTGRNFFWSSIVVVSSSLNGSGNHVATATRLSHSYVGDELFVASILRSKMKKKQRLRHPRQQHDDEAPDATDARASLQQHDDAQPAGNAEQQRAEQPRPEPSTLLLMQITDVYRRNGSIGDYFRLPKPFEYNNSTACSCNNPRSKFDCCERLIYRPHKMGFMLSQEIASKYKPLVQRSDTKRNYKTTSKNLSNLFPVDHRSVLLMRNIYSSLVSGYLYHAKGTTIRRIP